MKTRRSNVGSRKGNRIEPARLDTDYDEDELMQSSLVNHKLRDELANLKS